MLIALADRGGGFIIAYYSPSHAKTIGPTSISRLRAGSLALTLTAPCSRTQQLSAELPRGDRAFRRCPLCPAFRPRADTVRGPPLCRAAGRRYTTSSGPNLPAFCAEPASQRPLLGCCAQVARRSAFRPRADVPTRVTPRL